jgi:hypothetical protein
MAIYLHFIQCIIFYTKLCLIFSLRALVPKHGFSHMHGNNFKDTVNLQKLKKK